MYIISGRGNPLLTEDIVNYISREKSHPVTQVKVLSDKFSDGELRVEIQENLRGKDVYVVQSLSNPANEYIMELMLILDALSRSDVKSITLVISYYGYARQDKKIIPRSPISAKILASMLELYHPNRLITIDLHAPQIQGFFSIPVDNLYGSIAFIPHMKNHINGLVAVSPDGGGVERASYYAKRLDCGLAFCYKHRNKPNEIAEMRLIGEVKGKDCLLVDDMCDTGSTLVKASDILLENGAKSVHAYITHGVFSGNAVENLSNSSLQTINITDTILPSIEVMKNNKFNMISIAPLLGQALININNGDSVSKLFN